MQLAAPRPVTARVPRFFFHLYDDLVSRDDEGLELADDEAARSRAIMSAREMACAEVLEGRLSLNHRLDVEDESGSVIATVRFRDVVEIEA